MSKLAIGADIGGSHISCQLVDLQNNALIEDSLIRMQVDKSASKQIILNRWKEAILKSASSVLLKNIAGIGFAMPGPFDYPNGIALFDKNVQKFGNLFGVNVREELQSLLELPSDFPIRFLNDAGSFAVGEAWLGEASKFNRILALTLGTGFGTTFISNKLPVAGKDGVPDDGFLYHIPYKARIADDYFSTRWFVQEYVNRGGKQIKGVKDLADNYDSDVIAKELFSEFGENLGKFLLPWLKRFGAECVVIGGNISKSLPLFLSELQAELISYELKILPSTLNESAAIIGSAKLCDNKFYQKLIHQNQP